MSSETAKGDVLEPELELDLGVAFELELRDGLPPASGRSLSDAAAKSGIGAAKAGIGIS